MTLDDAAAILDVTEGHVQDLIRDRVLVGCFLHPRSGWRHGRCYGLKPGEWWVEGASVRRRKRDLAKRRNGR